MSTIIFIFTLITALLAIAFYTLLERKLLRLSQLRKGPNKVTISGITQPIADAIKLLTKSILIPYSANTTIIIASPFIAISIS